MNEVSVACSYVVVGRSGGFVGGFVGVERLERVAIGNKIVGASRVGVNLYGVVGNARREISCSFDTALCIENHLVVGNEDGNLVEVVGEIVVENLVER